MNDDPLWKMRHALAGVALALLLSVLAAAVAGRLLGDLLGDSYGLRVSIYGALLLYVVVGAGVLFAKVARHAPAALVCQPVAVAAAAGRQRRRPPVLTDRKLRRQAAATMNPAAGVDMRPRSRSVSALQKQPEGKDR